MLQNLIANHQKSSQTYVSPNLACEHIASRGSRRFPSASIRAAPEVSRQRACPATSVHTRARSTANESRQPGLRDLACGRPGHLCSIGFRLGIQAAQAASLPLSLCPRTASIPEYNGNALLRHAAMAQGIYSLHLDDDPR